jgi:hypothetical protein
MATALVEVPTGTLTFNTQEPGIWAGYVPNTVLSVRPDPRTLDAFDTEIEVTFSGINPLGVYPLLDGVEMDVISRSHNSMIIDTAPFITLGGPFRGTFGEQVIPPEPGTGPQPAWADVKFLFNFEPGVVYTNHVTSSAWTASATSVSTSNPKFGTQSIQSDPGASATIYRSYDSSYHWQNQDVTLEAWVWWDSAAVSSPDNARRLHSWANTGGIITYGFEVIFSTRKMQVYVWAGSVFSVVSAAVIPMDQWVHLVYDYDELANVLRMGMNGTFEAFAWSPTWSTASADLRIIGSNGNGAFPGKVNEMRFTAGNHYPAGLTYPIPDVTFPIGPY